jgi:DNA replication protein DnaC
VDGKPDHGDVSKFFPRAQSAACNGDGRSATVAYDDERYGAYTDRRDCPLCARDRLTAQIQAFTPPRFCSLVILPAAVTTWAELGRKAQGLYLVGQVGTGKTHAAWGALAAWCMATETTPHGAEGAPADWGGRVAPSVIFTRMTDLLDDLRPGENSTRRIRDCQHAALLVIDDIGAEKPSEWTQERFYSVVDHRYANCMPLILTGNIPPKELGPQVGERAASRLAEMCQVIPMTGADRRKPSA